MRNLKPYNADCLKFHDEVISRKQDIALVARLKALHTTINQLFNDYQDNFASNSLENIVSHGFTGQNKTDLLKLYNYNAKLIAELRNELTTGLSNRIFNTCQNCTINEVSSMDHILPKEDYSEFVVHPKNLFPSCTRCNSHKSSVWMENGKRVFLNLYLDGLPKEQYLFVNIKEVDTVLETEFYLHNSAGINEDLFRLIKDHYSRLKLLTRFSNNSHSIIAEIKASVNAQSKHLTNDEIKRNSY